MSIQVLQYNIQKSKNRVMVPLLEGNHKLYDIIAIQEPWLNPYNSTTYCLCSCQYNLIFSQTSRARTCILVNKQIPIAKWHSGQEPDYCWIRLDLESGPVTIHNIYSETPESYDTTAWNTPIPKVLEAINAPGRHLVVGDFNLHYTIWGGQAVRRAHVGAKLVTDCVHMKQ